MATIVLPFALLDDGMGGPISEMPEVDAFSFGDFALPDEFAPVDGAPEPVDGVSTPVPRRCRRRRLARRPRLHGECRVHRRARPGRRSRGRGGRSRRVRGHTDRSRRGRGGRGRGARDPAGLGLRRPRRPRRRAVRRTRHRVRAGARFGRADVADHRAGAAARPPISPGSPDPQFASTTFADAAVRGRTARRRRGNLAAASRSPTPVAPRPRQGCVRGDAPRDRGAGPEGEGPTSRSWSRTDRSPSRCRRSCRTSPRPRSDDAAPEAAAFVATPIQDDLLPQLPRAVRASGSRCRDRGAGGARRRCCASPATVGPRRARTASRHVVALARPSRCRRQSPGRRRRCRGESSTPNRLHRRRGAGHRAAGRRSRSGTTELRVVRCVPSSD